MPTYEYKCEECGHIFEIIQKITEEPLKFCPECRGAIKRLISAAGIVFKGSGFHVTDYKKKEYPPMPNASAGKQEHKPQEKKAEAPKPKETKSS